MSPQVFIFHLLPLHHPSWPLKSVVTIERTWKLSVIFKIIFFFFFNSLECSTKHLLPISCHKWHVRLKKEDFFLTLKGLFFSPPTGLFLTVSWLPLTGCSGEELPSPLFMLLTESSLLFFLFVSNIFVWLNSKDFKRKRVPLKHVEFLVFNTGTVTVGTEALVTKNLHDPSEKHYRSMSLSSKVAKNQVCNESEETSFQDWWHL